MAGENGVEMDGTCEAVEGSHDAEAREREAVDGSGKLALEDARMAGDSTRVGDPREAVDGPSKAVENARTAVDSTRVVGPCEALAGKSEAVGKSVEEGARQPNTSLCHDEEISR